MQPREGIFQASRKMSQGEVVILTFIGLETGESICNAIVSAINMSNHYMNSELCCTEIKHADKPMICGRFAVPFVPNVYNCLVITMHQKFLSRQR